MIIPAGIDMETATREELVAAYVAMGMDQETAEAFASLLFDPRDPDDPPVI